MVAKMTDPKIVAKEIIFGEWHDHTTVWKKMRPEHLKLHEQRIAQALLSERTTAYKTCVDVVLGLACKQHPFRSVIDGGCDTNETLLDAFEAIRTEANKEIK